MSQKVFRKMRVKYDETCLEFVLSDEKEQFFGKTLNFATELIKEINMKCNKFIEFQYFLRYRKYTLYSMYIILPFMFLLSVIGLTSEAFGLAWFFIAFLFLFMLCFFVVLYLISAKMNRQFLIYGQLTQEIIDRFNIKYFIKEGIFSSFRTRTISELLSSSSSRPDLLKSMRNNSAAKINFKFFVQSKLIRILRAYFWIEFIRFNYYKKAELSSPTKSRLSEIHVKYTPSFAHVKESEENEKSGFSPQKIKSNQPSKYSSPVKTPLKSKPQTPSPSPSPLEPKEESEEDSKEKVEVGEDREEKVEIKREEEERGSPDVYRFESVDRQEEEISEFDVKNHENGEKRG